MKPEKINTDQAPQPIGPYSQAIRAGNFLFLSGQIPINPKTGEVVKNNFADQCRLVLENTKAVLQTHGSSLQQVVKATVFLTDLQMFSEFNSIYTEYFADTKPARSCVQVCKLPKEVDIEMEVIAIYPAEDARSL